eukprot:TRINITY_DN3756_c0_g1_i2.p1 TRINITY_DN3756_c0_g1~~TRINITY_DN3756_c0_g1_i2.p1  ORF type:complete len:473 (+),score=69.94 TRINITY_DN3756_c0_g1_i2:196-1419(+)
MQESGMKVLRIFVSQVAAGAKGSSSCGVNDLEQYTVGDYDDTILSMIDTLMSEVVNYGVKLEIMLHDRYSLGCWSCDAYVAKYGITNTAPNCNTQENQPRVFYVDDNAQSDFDNRIVHILQHQNPHFNNRPWGQIDEAVFAFAPENEAQGHMNNPDWNWACRRAQTMKNYISNGILISTGGGIDFATSLVSNQFDCQYIDVVSMHDYSSSTSYFQSNLANAKSLAYSSGKRVIMEEFGAQGSDSQKASFYNSILQVIADSGIPFLPWEFLRPSTTDYEFYTDSTSTWQTVSCYSKAVLNQQGAFSWSMFSNSGAENLTCGGGGGNLPDWAFCTSSDQCQDNCCSVQYSNDGQYKCTPGGSPDQCLSDGNLSDWSFCSSSAQCADQCCSNQYSNDGQYKCTPGGTQCI